MILFRIFAIITILAIPFSGMAETDIPETQTDSAISADTFSPVETIKHDTIEHDVIKYDHIEYEMDSEAYIYDNDTLHSGDEYIYVTEYEKEKHIWDRVITRLLKTSVDTNYITTNDYGLQVNISFNNYGSSTHFGWEAISDTMPDHCTISSDNITKTGFWIGYRNFGLGYSIDITSLWKKKNKYNAEFNFSYYGDAWGVELGANQTLGSKLNFNNVRTNVPGEDIATFRIYINSYYAPFYRKFSYNAAFSHSMRQEKSAGSPLFGLSFNAFYQNAKSKELSSLLADMEFPSEITYLSLNINAGYAHNFVTKKKTLLHISALPDITVFKRTSVSPQIEGRNYLEQKLQYGIIARASWVWQRENHLISIFGTSTWHNLIRIPIRVSDLNYRAGICYGFRAYKHHRPHKKRIRKFNVRSRN